MRDALKSVNRCLIDERYIAVIHGHDGEERAREYAEFKNRRDGLRYSAVEGVNEWRVETINHKSNDEYREVTFYGMYDEDRARVYVAFKNAT